MKSVSVRFGLIAGLILAVMIFSTAPLLKDVSDIDSIGRYGMGAMVIALSMIFFAIRKVRNNLYGGYISFRDAFRTGLIVTLISTLIYTASWVIYFQLIDDKFIDLYLQHQTAVIEKSSVSVQEKATEIATLNEQMIQYRKLPVMILYTFMEIFPFGFVVTLLCAVLMKRKPPYREVVE